MVIQTKNSTYIVEWIPTTPGAIAGGTEGKWVADKFLKASAAVVRKHARAFAFQGNTLTLGIGERMHLTNRDGTIILDTSPVESIE
jgi:hypothetical protein